MEPIETEYKGYRFRSRLEARWAIFFEELGLDWGYEEQGYTLKDGTKYLPDFRVGQRPLFVEVKGPTPTEREIKKCDLLAQPKNWVLLVSGPPRYIEDDYKGVRCNGYLKGYELWYWQQGWGPVGEAKQLGQCHCGSGLALMEIPDMPPPFEDGQLYNYPVKCGCSQMDGIGVWDSVIESSRIATQARFEHGEKDALIP